MALIEARLTPTLGQGPLETWSSNLFYLFVFSIPYFLIATICLFSNRSLLQECVIFSTFVLLLFTSTYETYFELMVRTDDI